jgi:hypothetical protein
MARISTNDRLYLLSERVPGSIEAKRELDIVLPMIEKFHRDFLGFHKGPHSNEFKEFYRREGEMRERYMSALNRCSEELENSEHGANYYKPMLAFLENANDSHTIFPFLEYMLTFSHTSHPTTVTRTFVDFIGTRIEDSIQTCKAYMSLLSRSTNSESSRINLQSLVENVLSMSEQRAMYRIILEEDNSMLSRYCDKQDQISNDECDIFDVTNTLMGVSNNPHARKIIDYEIKKFKEFKQHILRSSTRDYKYGGAIYSYEPLAFFYLTNILSNHFKASWERIYLDHGPEPGEEHKPEVGVSIRNFVRPNGELDHEHIVIETYDNGVGMDEDQLKTLFDDESYSIGYNGALSGQSRTTRTFPFIVDLLRGALVVESKKDIGTSFALILPRDTDKPSNLTYDDIHNNQYLITGIK